ncbi:MAG TPA: hypothetical protein VKU41_13985 [Polyangiaceae bacterium]|nr:hypothetical protein [Polyangiaceae bacterium]
MTRAVLGLAIGIAAGALPGCQSVTVVPLPSPDGGLADAASGEGDAPDATSPTDSGAAPDAASPADAGAAMPTGTSPDAGGDAASADAWAPPAGFVYVKPSNTRPAPAAGNNTSAFQFGSAVALQNYTLVVGAPGESSGAGGVGVDGSDTSVPLAGAVYVFVRTQGAWTQQAYIKPTPGGQAGNFGWQVALDGDTLVVGAPQEAAGGTAYVFVRSSGVWTQQAALASSHRAPNQSCGQSVALSGDTLAFTCPGDATGGSVGSASVFTRAGSTWTSQAYLGPSTAVGFGSSVALAGDVLAVGDASQTNPADGTGRTQGGVVYVFTRTGAAWASSAYLSAANGPSGTKVADNDRFGATMALGQGWLAVGDGGAGVYVFAASGSTWAQGIYLTAADAGADPSIIAPMMACRFGYSLAADGDSLLIGAPGAGPIHTPPACTANTAACLHGPIPTTSGAAALYTRSGSTWAVKSFYALPGPNPAGGLYGSAVGVSGGTVAIADVADSSSARSINGNAADVSSPNAGAVWVSP